MLLNLLCNLVLPTLILTKLSGDNYLGIKLAIVVALAFPIIYGIHDFLTRGKLNFFSGLGIASVTLTGGISLLEMDAVYIAIKEAAIKGSEMGLEDRVAFAQQKRNEVLETEDAKEGVRAFAEKRAPVWQGR